jgi:hypothetical protein
MEDYTKLMQDAAKRLRDEFANAVAIETANYDMCWFVMAAAKLALEDEDIAARIGKKMEEMISKGEV